MRESGVFSPSTIARRKGSLDWMIRPHMGQIYAQLHGDQHGAPASQARRGARYLESGACLPGFAGPTAPDAYTKKFWLFRNRGIAAGLMSCRAPSAPLPQRPAFDTKAPPLIAAGPFLYVLQDCIDESGNCLKSAGNQTNDSRKGSTRVRQRRPWNASNSSENRP